MRNTCLILFLAIYQMELLGQTSEVTHIDPPQPVYNEEVFVHFHWTAAPQVGIISIEVEESVNQGEFRVYIDFCCPGAPSQAYPLSRDSLISLGFLQSGSYTAYVGLRAYSDPYWYRDTLNWFVIGPSGINEDENSGISIGPNPFSETVKLTSDWEIKSINIREIDGKLIDTQSVNSQTYFYAGQALPTGIYLLEIKTLKGTFIRKLVKF